MKLAAPDRIRFSSMGIYTKTGDGGETGLFDGTRVPKEDIRVASYGEVDELNSVLGLLRSSVADAQLDAESTTHLNAELGQIQADLFELGADLATPSGCKSLDFLPARIRSLEGWIDEIMDRLPRLQSFVLPGGCQAAALAHLARTVCRRAERACWAARRVHEFPDEILVYLNRLSDLLFAVARELNDRAGVADVPWKPRTTGSAKNTN